MAWYDSFYGEETPDSTKFQTGLGAGQLLAGAFLKKGSRPKMPIPGAVQEATSIARSQANATVRPGNEYAISQIKEREGASINTLQRSLGSGSQILAGVGQINQNTNRALAENANQNTLFKFNATQNLQNSLARLGQYQEKQFFENQMKPYIDRVQTKNMLIGSGIQNISGALNTKTEMDLYEKVFGNQSSQGGWNDDSAFEGAVNNYQPNKGLYNLGKSKFGNLGMNTTWPNQSWGSNMYKWPGN